jgi:hypothetical protein
MQSLARSRLTPLFIPPRKDHVETDNSPYLSPQGRLSPDIQPNTPPSFPTTQVQHVPGPPHQVSQIGRFLLAAPLESQGQVPVFRAIHMDTQQQYFCKVCTPPFLTLSR